MLARVAPLASRALPRGFFRPHARLVTPRNNAYLPFTTTRRYTTQSGEPKPEQTKQETKEETTGEEQGQKTEQQQQQQGQEQKKGGSAGGALLVYGIIGLGAVGIYYSGLANPLINFWNEHIFSSLSSFGLTLRNNVYHLFGISTEEMPFLPPPLPEGYGRKYTIVLDMDALAECTQTNGAWRIHKRAGLDYFLATLVRNYEIVLYTKEYPGVNQNAIFKLDPAGVLFQHQKFRDSGVKDPSMQFTDKMYLFRRDPSRIIFIDSTAPDKTYSHENVLCVGKPKLGEQSDTVLLDLTRILHSFAVHNGSDVRPLVHELQGPEVQAKIREVITKGSKAMPSPPQQQQQQQQQQGSGSKGWGGLFGR